MMALVDDDLDEGRGPTVEREHYSPVEHLANGLAHASRFLGLPVTRLDRDSLMATARRHTELEDFGDDRFLDGLDRILAESAGRYTGIGDALLRGLLTRGLEIRLRSVDYLKRHPDALEVPITEPIIVLGLPRSGTTVLHNLLSASLDRAPLEFWELTSVVPLDEADLEADRRRRIRQLARMLRLMDLFVPELKRMHHYTPITPEEDWWLLGPSFLTLQFDSTYGLQEYGRWLRNEADMVWAYGELKQRLQIILHQRPRQRLVLKCPDHSWFIDALTEVFPDARIVQTQRDPVDCIASYTSMISLQERTFTGRVERELLAARLTALLLDGARRAEAARQALDPARSCVVSYDGLVRDPAASLRAITDHFGLPAPNQPAISSELARPRADGPGSHRYSRERLGIEPEVIRRQFGWPEVIDG